MTSNVSAFPVEIWESIMDYFPTQEPANTPKNPINYNTSVTYQAGFRRICRPLHDIFENKILELHSKLGPFSNRWHQYQPKCIQKAWEQAYNRALHMRLFAKLREAEDPLGLHQQQMLYCFAFSCNGVYFAVSLQTRALQIWNTQTNDTFSSSDVGARCLQFSPTAPHLLVSGTRDGITIWQITSNKISKLSTFDHPGLPYKIVFSPSGNAFSMQYTLHEYDKDLPIIHGVEIRDITTTTKLLEKQNIASIDFSSNGRLLAMAGAQVVSIINTQDYTELPLLPTLEKSRSYSRVRFSPDSKLLAGVLDKCILQLWDVETRKPIRYSAHAANSPYSEIYDLVFSRSSRCLITASYDSVMIWDLLNGKQRCLENSNNYWHRVSFIYTQTSKFLVSIGNVVVIWNFRHNQFIRYTAEEEAREFTLSPDGKFMAVRLRNGSYQLWDVRCNGPALLKERVEQLIKTQLKLIK